MKFIKSLWAFSELEHHYATYLGYFNEEKINTTRKIKMRSMYERIYLIIFVRYTRSGLLKNIYQELPAIVFQEYRNAWSNKWTLFPIAGGEAQSIALFWFLRLIVRWEYIHQENSKTWSSISSKSLRGCNWYSIRRGRTWITILPNEYSKV